MADDQLLIDFGNALNDQGRLVYEFANRSTHLFRYTTCPSWPHQSTAHQWSLYLITKERGIAIIDHEGGGADDDGEGAYATPRAPSIIDHLVPGMLNGLDTLLQAIETSLNGIKNSLSAIAQTGARIHLRSATFFQVYYRSQLCSFIDPSPLRTIADVEGLSQEHLKAYAKGYGQIYGWSEHLTNLGSQPYWNRSALNC